jgi:hypothetical protein
MTDPTRASAELPSLIPARVICALQEARDASFALGSMERVFDPKDAQEKQRKEDYARRDDCLLAMERALADAEQAGFERGVLLAAAAIRLAEADQEMCLFGAVARVVAPNDKGIEAEYQAARARLADARGQYQRIRTLANGASR